VAALAILLSTTFSPAQAATRRVPDKVGDSNAANDVTWLKIHNGRHRFRVVAHFRDLGSDTYSEGVALDTGKKGAWGFFLTRYENYESEKGRVRLSRSRSHPYRYHRVTCPRARVDYYPGPKSKIIYEVPQRCLGEHKGHAWVQESGAYHEGPNPPKPEHAPNKPVLVARG
jgi:hypothetical protein